MAAVLLLASSSPSAAIGLNRNLLTREDPNNLSACATPQAAAQFPPTADRIYVWFLVSNVVLSDQISAEWITPSGAIYQRWNWERYDSASRCYWSSVSPRADNIGVSTWTVRVTVNGALLFFMPVRIVPLGTACPELASGLNRSIPGLIWRGDCYFGELVSSRDTRPAHRHRVEVPAGGQLRLDVMSTDFDAMVYLLDRNGQYIDWDDDSGDRTNARIIRHIDSGTYTVIVTSFSGGSGTYILRTEWRDPLSCGGSTIYVPGSEGGSLGANEGCRLSSFDPYASEDKYARLYRIVVKQPGEVTFDLRSTAFDSVLYLLDNRLRWLAFDDDSGGNRNSRITRWLEAGVYYAVVSTYDSLAFGAFTFQASQAAGEETITLLLHGLNSSAATWDALNENEFGGDCATIDYTDLESVNIFWRASCYRYNFRSRNVAGRVWTNGDGATFDELGEEVGAVVDWIRKRHALRSLIVIGHSRGGLAARAYLQSAGEREGRLPFRTGLITIGTPHLGSPFGRFQWYLTSTGVTPGTSNFILPTGDQLVVAFMPSTGHMASSHAPGGVPVRVPISEKIWALNSKVTFLSLSVDIFGELRSSGLKFGENVSGGLSGLYLDASSIAHCLSNTPEAMIAFVEANLPQTWLTASDGIVAFESQQLANVPGFSGRVLSDDIKQKTSHVDETKRTAAIRGVIDRVSAALRELPSLSQASQESPHLPSVQSLEIFRSPDPRASEKLGQAAEALLRSKAFSDTDWQRGVLAVAELGSEKAARLLMDDAGRRADAAIGSAEYEQFLGRIPARNTHEVLAETLRSSGPDSPQRMIAARSLAQRGDRRSVELLISWAAGLDEPWEQLLNVLSEISSTNGIGALEKSVTRYSFRNPMNLSQAREASRVVAIGDSRPGGRAVR